jgi:two-component sensor histidine kinase
LRWAARNGQLDLNWRETGGPPVKSPSRRGFGSRLLEEGLARDLDGQTQLEFAAEGVRCSISAALAMA